MMWTPATPEIVESSAISSAQMAMPSRCGSASALFEGYLGRRIEEVGSCPNQRRQQNLWKTPKIKRARKVRNRICDLQQLHSENYYNTSLALIYGICSLIAPCPCIGKPPKGLAMPLRTMPQALFKSSKSSGGQCFGKESLVQLLSRRSQMKWEWDVALKKLSMWWRLAGVLHMLFTVKLTSA